MSAQAHPLTDLGFQPEAPHPLSDLGFQPASDQRTQFEKDRPQLPENYGFTAENMFSKAWSGVKELAGGAATMGKDILFPEGKTEGDKLSWLAHKYIFDPADREQVLAQNAPDALTSIGHSIAQSLPLVGPWAASLGEQAGTGDIGGAVARGGAQVVTGAAATKAIKTIPEAVSKVGEVGKTVVKEAMGAGPSTERMGADRIAHAQAVKEHISNVEDAVHEKAKAGAAGIDSAVDEANPKGFFDKSGMRMGVRDALGEISKIPEKWPGSIGKLLAEDKVTRTTGPSVGGRTMDLSNPADLKAFQRYKEAGVFSPEEIQRMEGSEKIPNWTMEQVRQLRSEVGRDLGRYENKGAIGAALNNVYGYLSKEMRKAATTVGMEPDFLKNNAEYKQWMDDFHRSPLKKVLNGQTSGMIIKALSDERSQGLIDKYQDYGMDSQALKEEAKRAAISGTISRFSRPSKWDLIVAAYKPHVAAIRLLAPYFMRNPKLLDALGGKGLPVEEGVKNIKPAQVYINKKAAALAARNR